MIPKAKRVTEENQEHRCVQTLSTFVLSFVKNSFVAVQFLSCCCSEQICLDSKALSCSKLDKSWKSSDCTYMSTWTEGQLIVSASFLLYEGSAVKT